MPTPRAPRPWMLVVCGLALTLSCSSEPRSERAAQAAAAEEPLTAPRVGTAADVRGMPAAPITYAWSAGALASDSPTFESRIAEGGQIQITPRLLGPLAPQGSTLAIETSLVSRGGTVLASGRAAPRIERDGSVIVARGPVTERVANDGTGLEQSWLFDHAPRGEGNLVVRVRATGQRYAASTDHGLHFTSTEGSLGLRYGTATWIDAGGKRTVVRPRFSGDEIVLVVPESVVATSRYPAVLDPTVTVEKEVDAPVVPPNGGAASGNQQTPSIAAVAGGGYVAVWADRRGARPAFFGARIKSDGTVLDGTGVPLVQGVGQLNYQQSPPYVAASPSGGFIIVWIVTKADQYQSPGIYGMRFDANLQPLDAAPVLVAANQTQPQYISAASDGTNYLVVWQKNNGAPTYGDIAAVRIGSTGSVLDAAPIEISKLVDYEYSPYVTFDGTKFLVAWRSYYALFTRTVATDGTLGSGPVTVHGTPGTPGSFYVYDLRLAWDPTAQRHLLAWYQYSYSGSTYADVLAKRLDTSGAAVDAVPLPVAADASYDQNPRVVSDANGWIVTWSRGASLMGTRVARNAVIDAPTTVATATYSGTYDHAAASDGAGTVDVFTDDNPNSLLGSNVKGVKLGTTVAAATPFIVSRSVNAETEPSTAWNGSTYFAVWLDTRDNRGAIYGAPISASGEPATPVKLFSDPAYAGEFQRPRIASDGTGFLVVFVATDSLGQRGVRGLRIDGSGTVDGAGVFPIWIPTNEQDSDVSVAFDGTNYLVVFAQQNSSTYPYPTGIGAIRVPKTGTTMLDTAPLRITPISSPEQRAAPSVAFDGQNYFVAWSLSRPVGASNLPVSHIYGTRVTKEGTVLDGEQTLCDAFLLQSAPFVTADSTSGGFFVVWEDNRTALDSADVYGARISAQGQALDGTAGFKIAAGAYDESRPRAAPAGDGINWVVAWRDFRSKTTYDIYGAWVSASSGRVLDPDGYKLSAEPGDEDAPWLDSSAGNRKALLTYQRLDPQTGYGSFRVRTRVLDSGLPTAQACTSNDDCASRSCADGVCCATPCGGCGVCNQQPGTCTPRPAGSESAACGTFKCGGSLDCPVKCDGDQDCAGNATCDPNTHACVSRIICTDDHTLKDLSGALKDCAPYKCIGDACRTQCGSVDDCASGFVCDTAGRCVRAPGQGDLGGCTTASTSAGHGLAVLGLAWMAASIGLRRRKRRSA